MKKRMFAAALVLALLAGCAMTGNAPPAGIRVTLSGSEEVPAVRTSAIGSGIVTVNADGTVSVNITTTGIAATAAHIHMAPAGQNGPVVVPFTRSGDAWVAAPGAKLTEAQFAAYKAGNLYVNVHSAANPGGEIRAQIRP